MKSSEAQPDLGYQKFVRYNIQVYEEKLLSEQSGSLENCLIPV